jgi:hypothetical protein
LKAKVLPAGKYMSAVGSESGAMPTAVTVVLADERQYHEEWGRLPIDIPS